VVETNAGALIRVLRGIPGTRHVCLEEGTHASWLYEVLSPHVEEIVVAGVRESQSPKSDKLDAFGLAEQLRIGAIKRKVYKKRGEFGALRHRAKACTLLVADSVRVQNRIKSLFRSRGVAGGGQGSVFGGGARDVAEETTGCSPLAGRASDAGTRRLAGTAKEGREGDAGRSREAPSMAAGEELPGAGRDPNGAASTHRGDAVPVQEQAKRSGRTAAWGS
jgi:hypothetical protein